jgi:hypothetical protein
MTTQPAKERLAARVLLIDAARRVLLFRGSDPATPRKRYWFTVGGGLEEGEGHAAAAARELFEVYRQRQEFFGVVVDSWEVDESGFQEEELRDIDAHRWWTRDELLAKAEIYYPDNLVELVDRVVALGLPMLRTSREDTPTTNALDSGEDA